MTDVAMGRPSGRPRTEVRAAISAVEAAQVMAVVAAALLPLVIGILLGWAVALLLLLAVAPLAVFGIVHGRFGRRGMPAVPGLFISGAFAVFIGAGVLAWALSRRQTDIGFPRILDSRSVVGFVAAMSAFSVAVILGERIAISPRDETVAPGDEHLGRLAHVLFFLVCLSGVDLARRLGGWTSAAQLLSTHRRTDTAGINGSLGLSLWSLFALPALISLGAAALSPRRSGSQRILLGVEAGFVAWLALFVFGSRLIVTLAGIGILAARYADSGRTVRLRALGVAVAAMLVVSLFVLASRPGGTGASTGAAEKLRILSYSIFDVSTAAWQDRRQLAPQIRSVGRTTHLLFAAIPVLGPRSASLNGDRIDVMVGEAIEPQTGSSPTGLPPSLPTVALITAGVLGAIGAGLLFGWCIGRISNLLRRRSFGTGGAAYGLWCAFTFTVFKDGDVLIAFVTEVKRWIYLLVLVALLRLARARAERRP